MVRTGLSPEAEVGTVRGRYDARDLVRVPGLLSLSRLAFAAAFPFLLARPAWALAVLGAAGLSDVLDGWYARRFKQQSAMGAVLDPVTDKIFVLAVAASLLLSGRMSIVETLLLGTRDVGEIAIAALLAATGRRKALGDVPSPNVAGKLATAAQYVAVVAIVVRSAYQDVAIAIAALAGVAAFLTYWARYDRRAPAERTTDLE